MKVKQILSIKEIADDKRLPCDMYELYNTKYMSVSRDKMISIEDMDIVHLIRAFKNDRHRLANQLTDDDLLRQIRDLVSANKELGKQLDQEVRNDTQEGKIVPLIQENLSLARQRDSWKEKSMNMMERSSYDRLQNRVDSLTKDLQNGFISGVSDLEKIEQLEMENQRLVQQLEADEHNVGKLDDTVPKATYQVMWDNCQSLQNQAVKNRNENKELKNKYEELRKTYAVLLEDYNIDTGREVWKDRYEHELKMAEYWKDAFYKKDVIKGCGYTFSEIPNDTDGQEFVDNMKKYFNKKSYKMRVRGQHVKPELRGTGVTSHGQNIDESTHLRVYIDVK